MASKKKTTKAEQNGQAENAKASASKAQEAVELEPRDQEKLDRLMEQRIALDSRIAQVATSRAQYEEHLETLQDQESNLLEERSEVLGKLNEAGQEVESIYGVSFEEYQYDKANGVLVKKGQ